MRHRNKLLLVVCFKRALNGRQMRGSQQLQVCVKDGYHCKYHLFVRAEMQRGNRTRSVPFAIVRWEGMAAIRIHDVSSHGNEISAHQVITGLAIAVKELIENAIDAGASALDITLVDYGLSVQVSGSSALFRRWHWN